MSVFRVSLFRVSLAGQVDWRTELFVTRLHHYYEDFSNDDAWVFIFFFFGVYISVVFASILALNQAKC